MRLGAEGIENKKVSGVNLKTGKSLFFENRIASKWLTTKEASVFLGVSENAVRIMVHRGQISSYKFGRRLRFKLSDCEALFISKGAL